MPAETPQKPTVHNGRFKCKDLSQQSRQRRQSDKIVHYLLGVLRQGLSVYSSNYPESHRDQPASASQELVLKARANITCPGE